MLRIIRFFLQISSAAVIFFVIYFIFQTSHIQYHRSSKLLSNSEITFIQKLLTENNDLTHPPKVLTTTKKVPILCYFSNQSAMSDLTTKNVTAEKSVFFVDTSCESSKRGKIVIEALEACAIESAALKNPDYKVHALFLSPGKIKMNGTLSDRLLKTVAEYSNVEILHLNLTKLAGSMQMNHLLSSRNPDLASKYLLLKKYGGIYLDLDVIVVKPFKSLSRNFIGRYANGNIRSSVISWRQNWNVPVTITKISSLTDTLGSMVCNNLKSKCDGFTVFPEDIFYPVRENDWKVFLKRVKNTKSLLKTITKKSFTVKIYKHVQNVSVKADTLYNRLLSTYCPKVFKTLKSTLK